MLIRLLLSFMRMDFVAYYPSIYSFFGHVIGTIMTLVVYHYTSVAFGPNFNDLGVNYFTFILVGELTLLSGSSMLDFVVRQMRSWKVRGIFDYTLSTPMSAVSLVVLRSLAAWPRDIILVMTQLLLAALFFDLALAPLDVVVVLFYPMLAAPAFLGLGMLALSIMLVTGRGGSAISYITMGLTVLAGAYFPLTVLPGWAQAIGTSSPYGALLHPIRQWIYTHDITVLWQALPTLMLWNISALILGIMALKAALYYYQGNHDRHTYEL